MVNGLSVGDEVVPLASTDEWRRTHPYYVAGMDPYVGHSLRIARIHKDYIILSNNYVYDPGWVKKSGGDNIEW